VDQVAELWPINIATFEVMHMHIGRALWQVTWITVLLSQVTVCTVFADESPGTDNAKQEQLNDRELQRSGARIGLIIVEVDNVFNANDPEENGLLYRVANALHIKTRNRTILTQLLFKKGDVYNRHELDESARNLRQNHYLNEADITPVQYHADDNTVDVLVRVRDVWTFNPGISYGRSGGTNHSGIQLSEGNLLGYGKSLTLQADNTVDRSDEGVSYSDPNLLNSRWQLDTTYIHASDGGTQSLTVDRPFFSLDTRWSGSVAGVHERRIDRRYQMATVIDQYQTTHEGYNAQLGWSTGLQDGWVQRWYLGYNIDRLHYDADPITGTLQLPQDQHLAYPWIGLQWLEDRYEVTRNRDQIGRTEDVYYGRALNVQLGLSGGAFGSQSNSDTLQLTLQDAKHIGDYQSLFGSIAFKGIYHTGSWRNSLVTAIVRYDLRPGPRNMFTARFTADYGIHLDPLLPLYLGDDDGTGELGNGGLRGYPLHYRSGTHREILNVEQRFYSNWQLLRLLTVGAAAFVDIGHIGGGTGVDIEGNHTLSDIGVGLRLGNIRSSKGEVFHLNAAYPLNATGTARKLQLQIITKQSF